MDVATIAGTSRPEDCGMVETADLDFREISDEDFIAMCESGDVLAAGLSARSNNLLSQVGTYDIDGEPNQEPISAAILVTLAVEVTAVVVGVVAGEVASVIASRRLHTKKVA